MIQMENWQAGKITAIAVIVAVCIGAISAFTFLLTPSQIREYRVKLDERGIYRVVAVVRYGEDFVAYQTTDGKEAIGISAELNDSLVRDNNGGPPHMKPSAWKRVRGAEAAENDRGRAVR